MAKPGNPYRCRYCGALASSTLVCKRCLPKQNLAESIKQRLEDGKMVKTIVQLCRIQGCNKEVHTTSAGVCELCKDHFYGNDIPLIRKSFVSDPNHENIYGGTPGAIPIRGGADEFHKKIEGWK